MTKERPEPFENSKGDVKDAEDIKRCKKSYFPSKVNESPSPTQQKHHTPDSENSCGGDNYQSKTRNHQHNENGKRRHGTNQQEKHQRTENDRNDVPLMKYDQK
ncbi:12827_t:CDS:1, partial [Acaulospora colombiana]